MTQPPRDEYLRPADVEANYAIAVGTLKSWRHDGYGPDWFRLGQRRIVYRRSVVEAWITEQEQRGTGRTQRRIARGEPR